MEPTTARILTDDETSAFRRDRRRRRAALTLLHLAIPALLALLAAPVAQHLRATLWLTQLGADVEWRVDPDAWYRGGVSSVSFPDVRNNIRDPDLEALRHLNNLERLDLAQCDSITDRGLAALRDLRRLKTLDLARNRPLLPDEDGQPQLSDAALAHVAALPGLTELTLTGNRITDAGLARLERLSALEFLDLGETLVTDAGLEHLKGLKRLKTLTVTKTRVTPAGALDLERALPGIQVIFGKGQESPEPGDDDD